MRIPKFFFKVNKFYIGKKILKENRDMGFGAVIYLLIGTLAAWWLERLLVDQGNGNELGIVFSFVDRIMVIVLWPVTVLPTFLSFISLLLKNCYNNDFEQSRDSGRY